MEWISSSVTCTNNHGNFFRKKHSTNHALISITEQIRDALDNNKTAVGVFVDFQKAFDTVNHSILIKNWTIMASEAVLTTGSLLTFQIVNNLSQ